MDFKTWLEDQPTQPGISIAGVEQDNEKALAKIGTDAEQVLKQGGDEKSVQKTLEKSTGDAMKQISGNVAKTGIGSKELGSVASAAGKVAQSISPKKMMKK